MAEAIAGRQYMSQRGTDDDRRAKLVQRVLILVIVVLTLVLVGELVFHLVIAPRLLIQRIDVDSDLALSEQELLSAAGVRLGVSYFDVDASAIEAAIRELPSAHSVHVERVFPDRLQIVVAARTPLAIAVADTQQQSVPLVCDASGVVFQVGSQVATADLPIISGLRFQDVAPGIRLPTLVLGFLEDVQRLRLDAPVLFALCSEFRIVRLSDFMYEVVLYTTHYRVPVRIGASIDEEMLQYIVMMLDVLEETGELEGLKEIDFRSGEGVLVMQEGVRG